VERTAIRNDRAWGWAVAVAVALAAVLVLTLFPGRNEKSTSFVPLRMHAEAVGCVLTGCDDLGDEAQFLFKDVAGNLVLFFPVGAALAGALPVVPDRRRFWVVTALGLVLSIGIESAQLAIPTRATDVDDVLLNVVGCAMGAGTMLWWLRRRAASRR
jgi:glycopeptide antibiotics resistance protein